MIQREKEFLDAYLFKLADQINSGMLMAPKAFMLLLLLQNYLY